MTIEIANSGSLPNLPWQERPAGCSDVLWRYDHNPVIPRSPFPQANSTFNSAVIAYQGGYAGVFRIDDTCRVMNLYLGFSDDGLDWPGIHKQYAAMLDDCASREDVGYVISEMISELNVGHAYYFGGGTEQPPRVDQLSALR